MDFAPLNVHVSKASVDGKVYDVLSYEEYVENYQLNKDRTDIAIKEDYQGETVILPYRGKYTGFRDSPPGVYNAGSLNFIKMPDQITMKRYIPDQIVSFNSNADIREMLSKAEAARKLDKPYLTSPDNVTTIKIDPDDQPEMKCLKMAINAKHIDIDKYAGRFGANFPNDKRQLKSNAVTLNIIKRYCENCDMEAILTLKDTSDDVPNPMGKSISVSLTDIKMSDLESSNEEE